MKQGPLRATGGVLAFCVLWQVMAGALFEFDYLPPPSLVATGLVRLAYDGEVFGEIVHTLMAVLLGWLISVVIGLALGIALGLSRTARTYCLATIEVLRPLPGIAFVPVAILIFGFSLQTELIVIVIPTVWPILLNTAGAFAAIPSRLHDVVRSFRMSSMNAMTAVFAPAAAPGILIGCRLSMTLALIMAVAVEMIGNPAGLGYAVIREAAALKPDSMFAYIFIIGLLGILLNQLLVTGAKRLLPGEFNRPRTGLDPA